MTSRSVSVTGATGFLGWHLAGEFLRRGWTVRAVVRPGSVKPLPPGAEVAYAAIDDPESLKAAFAGSETIVHGAAVTRAPSERAFRAVNVEGTRAVVAAANATGSRLILISSLAAIGPGTPERPTHEDDRPRPLTPYGRSKLASEAVVRSDARVPWTILRPSAVYGPRDRLFLPLARIAARGWFPLVAKPATAFTLIYADDLARAVRMTAEDLRSVGEALFLGHPEPQTAWGILRQLAQAVGKPFRPLRVPPLVLRAVALAGEASWRLGLAPVVDVARLAELRAEGWVCAVDRARAAIEFMAETPLAEGLERTIRWYRDQQWI